MEAKGMLYPLHPLLAPLNCFSWQDVSVCHQPGLIECTCCCVDASKSLFVFADASLRRHSNQVQVWQSFISDGTVNILIYRGKRFRAFTTPRTKWRASKRWLFFPPLVFSICALSLCKSLHAARHLDCTLGQRYEHNFKRQSRDGGAPWWFHHWQDRLQASGSKPHFDLGRFISSEPLLSGGVGESKAWQQLGSCLSKMFKIRLQRIELEGRVFLRPNKRTHDDGEHLEYE